MRVSTLALVSLLLTACADPCVDDGVKQADKGNCPGQSAGATEGATGTGTDDATASLSGSASATQASASASAGDSTTAASATEASMTAASGADASATEGTSATQDASGTGEPSCTNGVVDGDESDVDCGGSCPACRDGQMCNQSADCESAMCTLDMICGGKDSCTVLIDDNGCQACIKDSCCDAVLECFMDDFCRCWVECIEHNNDFDPCVDTCMGTAKPGSITSCANSQCNEPGACGN